MSSKPQYEKIEVLNPHVPFGEYRQGLETAIYYLARHISNKEMNSLIFDKLQLSNPQAQEESYIQAAAELTVCAYFAWRFPESFIYEKQLNPPKNVECAFEIEGISINVEVKCANYSKQHAIKSSSDFQMSAIGRLNGYDEICESLSSIFSSSSTPAILKRTQHMDNKLKDYLLSGHGKFSPFPNDKELNVLIVCCDSAFDMQQWFGYLYANRGLFTDSSFVQPASYANVDLVMLTNLYHRHYRPHEKEKIKMHWALDRAFNFLCPNPKSGKPSKNFEVFSCGMPHLTNQVRAHLDTMQGDAPASIKEALLFSDFVGHQLERGEYYFNHLPK